MQVPILIRSDQFGTSWEISGPCKTSGRFVLDGAKGDVLTFSPFHSALGASCVPERLIATSLTAVVTVVWSGRVGRVPGRDIDFVRS